MQGGGGHRMIWGLLTLANSEDASICTIYNCQCSRSGGVVVDNSGGLVCSAKM